MSKNMRKKVIKNTNADVLKGFKYINDAEQKMTKFDVVYKKSKTLSWVIGAIVKDLDIMKIESPQYEIIRKHYTDNVSPIGFWSTTKHRTVMSEVFLRSDAYTELRNRLHDVCNQHADVLEEMEVICYQADKLSVKIDMLKDE